jgi:hypothetical protein
LFVIFAQQGERAKDEKGKEEEREREKRKRKRGAAWEREGPGARFVFPFGRRNPGSGLSCVFGGV